MYYEAQDVPREIASRLYASLIAPRPVFLIGTVDSSDRPNLAPYSSLTLVASFPPMIAISFGERNHTKKDTLLNIEATGELVVNLLSRSQAEASVKAAEKHNSEVDEYARIGFTRSDFSKFRAGRVDESPASFGCNLITIHDLSPSSCKLVVAQVTAVFVNDKFLTTDNEFGACQANLFASIGAERYISLENAEEFILQRTWE